MVSKVWRGAAVGALVLCCACAGALQREVDRQIDRRDGMAAARAYDRYRGSHGPNDDLLARVAAAQLEQAAWSRSAPVRDAALTELTISGDDGEPVLDRLAESAGVTVTRARALAALVERGHHWARAHLYALLDDPDPEVVAQAVTAIDPTEETGRLLTLLEHPAAVVREAAAHVLVGAPRLVQVRWALARVARGDPDPGVRAAAVEALGAQGRDALDALRERFGDPSSVVRMAAVGALLRVDLAAGAAAVGSLLATPPSATGIEGARQLLTALRKTRAGWAQQMRTDAIAYLVGTLRGGSGPLRSQAAVAVTSLPQDVPALDAALLDALENETDPDIRFQLANAALQRVPHDPRPIVALEAVQKGDGMAAVQAAAVLARHGNPKSPKRLAHAMRHAAPVVRAAAARALACAAGRPDAARSAMLDRDPIVRIHAAGAILRCAER